MFRDSGVNFGEPSGGLRPIKSVLRLRQQFNRLLAFVDRILFPTHARENGAELPVTSWIVRSLTHEFLSQRSGVLECGLRLHLVALIQIKPPFQESFWTRGSVEVRQCLSVKLLHHFESIGKFPLQRQNPNPLSRNQPIWIESRMHQGQLIFGEANVTLPPDRYVRFV